MYCRIIDRESVAGRTGVCVVNNDDERTTSGASLNDSFYVDQVADPFDWTAAWPSLQWYTPANAQRPQRPDTADAEQHLRLSRFSQSPPYRWNVIEQSLLVQVVIGIGRYSSVRPRHSARCAP
ncbi:MAG: hypothetical protein ACLUEV_02470 [Alistipes sp.]